MKKQMWATVVAILIALPLLVNFAAADDAKKDPAGKLVFLDKKCNSCHSVDAQGIKLPKAKMDLSSIGLIAKADFIKEYITKKSKLNDKLHMVAFKGSDEELKNLIDWFMTLKTAPQTDKK